MKRGEGKPEVQALPPASEVRQQQKQNSVDGASGRLTVSNRAVQRMSADLRTKARQQSQQFICGPVKPNWGDVSEGVGGALVDLLLLPQPPPRSYWIATTQRELTSKRSGKEEQCKLLCEIRRYTLQKRAVRARTYGISAFRLALCIHTAHHVALSTSSHAGDLLNALCGGRGGAHFADPLTPAQTLRGPS